MALASELVKSYAPMLVALLVVVMLHRTLHGNHLNFALFFLVLSEIALMLKTTGRDSDLVTEIKKRGYNSQESEALEHAPRILVEILTRFLMPKAGDLALTVLYVSLLVHNVFTFVNGED